MHSTSKADSRWRATNVHSSRALCELIVALTVLADCAARNVLIAVQQIPARTIRSAMAAEGPTAAVHFLQNTDLPSLLDPLPKATASATKGKLCALIFHRGCMLRC